MKNKQINKKLILYITILAVLFILVAIVFTMINKNKDKETLEINTPQINIQTDLNFTVPGKTDEEVQAELNKELTEDEYNAFIDFIDKSQQDIMQLEDINNSDYVEYNENGSITYLDSDGDLITYNNQVEVPDNIFDMSLAEFVEYRETEREVEKKEYNEQQEQTRINEEIAPEEFTQALRNMTDEERQQWQKDTGVTIVSDTELHTDSNRTATGVTKRPPKVDLSGGATYIDPGVSFK